MSYDVFISSKSTDYVYAYKLLLFFEKNGIHAFLGCKSLPEEGDSFFLKEIIRALAEAKHMVIVASSIENVKSSFVEGEWCAFLNELLSGRKANGNILTLLVGGLSCAELPPLLSCFEVRSFCEDKFGDVLPYVGKGGVGWDNMLSLPRFVSHWTGREGLPQELVLSGAHIGRANELACLMSRLKPKAVVPILGQTGAGKSTMVQRFVSDSDCAKMVSDSFPGRTLSLLYVVLGEHSGPYGATRAILSALGVQKRNLNESEDGGIGLGELLANRFKGSNPLVLFENAQCRLIESSASSDVVSLLRLIASFGGASVVISIGAQPPQEMTGKYLLQPEIVMPPLSIVEAAELLTVAAECPDVARDAAQKLAPLKDVLYPGILVAGAQCAIVSAARAKRSVNSGDLVRGVVDMAADYFVAAQQELDAVGCAWRPEAEGGRTSFNALLVCGIVGEQPFNVSSLAAAELPALPIKELQDRGVIVETNGAYRIAPLYRFALGSALAELLKTQKTADFERLLAKMVGRFLVCGNASCSPGCDSIAVVSDEALVWVETNAPTAIILQDKLRQYVSAAAIDDCIFPLSREEAAAFISRQVPEADLQCGLAALSVAARYEEDGDCFLSLLKRVMAEANKLPFLNGQALRILDVAAFLAVRRFRAFEDTLMLRKTLVPKLMTALGKHWSHDLAFVKWTASWCLNTARLCLVLGQIEDSKKCLDIARYAMTLLPEPVEEYARQDSFDLKYRISRIEGQLSGPNRIKFIKLSHKLATEALAVSGGHPRWVHRLLRVTRQLLEDTSDSNERGSLIRATVETMLRVFHVDSIGHAPCELRLRVAALMRDAANLEHDPGVRFENASRALQLLDGLGDGLLLSAEQGDPRGLLVLARTQAFCATCDAALGKEKQALELLQAASGNAMYALECSPSVAAWELHLHLLEEIGGTKRSLSFLSENEHLRLPLSLELRNAISSYRKWAKEQPAGRLDGDLELWCTQRFWIAEGSLESFVRERVGEDLWRNLTREVKCNRIMSAYQRRSQLLCGIEHRLGPSPSLFVAMIKLESQYRRLLALEAYGGNGVCDVGPVLTLFERASGVYACNVDIMAEEARFYRYIWSYSFAIDRYRRVIAKVSRAEQRRELQVELAETLLTVAVHGAQKDDATLPKETELISEALRCVDSVRGFRHIMTDAALLRDQIEYEAGMNVDWQNLEKTYSEVIGDDYAQTLLTNLDSLRGEVCVQVEHLAEVVHSEFTSLDVLGCFGSLFMRRAEKEADRSCSLENARRAYFVYCACRILESAWYGYELPITRYRRARALLVAVTRTGSRLPFRFESKQKSDGLVYAESLLASATSRSVGLFNIECKRLRKKCVHLRRVMPKSGQG